MMKRYFFIPPILCSTTEEEQEEACGNKHTMGLGEFGCEYEEALSLRKVVPITLFSDLYVLTQFHHT
jgi:hypothetical protein